MADEYKECLDEIEKITGNRDCKILIYGTSRTGKTALANALLGIDCSKEQDDSKPCSGPRPGTKNFLKMQCQTDVNTVTVYDTPGLLYHTVDEVISEIKRECHPKDMDCVIICFPFAGAFNETLLTRLHELDPTVWGKVVFALTKCDELPADIKRKEPEIKQQGIERMKKQWREMITETLKNIGVDQKVIENIQIALTTYVEEEKHIDWSDYSLDNPNCSFVNQIFDCILQNITNHPLVQNITNHPLVQNIKSFISFFGDLKKLKIILLGLIVGAVGGAIGGGVIAACTLPALIPIVVGFVAGGGAVLVPKAVGIALATGTGAIIGGVTGAVVTNEVALCILEEEKKQNLA